MGCVLGSASSSTIATAMAKDMCLVTSTGMEMELSRARAMLAMYSSGARCAGFPPKCLPLCATTVPPACTKPRHATVARQCPNTMAGAGGYCQAITLWGPAASLRWGLSRRSQHDTVSCASGSVKLPARLTWQRRPVHHDSWITIAFVSKAQRTSGRCTAQPKSHSVMWPSRFTSMLFSLMSK